ncbi:MAG: hypothetical protein ACR2F6_02400 [Mycobacteriales bacterium]
MSLPSAMRVTPFPPGRRGVLLPADDHAAASAGICMYTASKPWVIRGQQLAELLVRRIGMSVLPGKRAVWKAPCVDDDWNELNRGWEQAIGSFDGVSLYLRRQHDRSGLTMVLTDAGIPRGIVKLRDDKVGLEREQRALHAVAAAQPTAFRAPRPFGTGSTESGWHWSAQEAVFTRPHRPVLRADDGLFAQVSDVLTGLYDVTADSRPAHNDLTPWNLRADHHGITWLIDWEDCGEAPLGSDRTYFFVSAFALAGTAVPTDLPAAAVEHWSALITSRPTRGGADSTLRRRQLQALVLSGV